MGHKWITAVLADLRAYAEINDLSRLAASLGDVERLAEAEIAAAAGTMPGRAWGDGAGPGTLLGTPRPGAQPS